MSETNKETIWGNEPVEHAVLDYDKLRFDRVYPPSLPGDTAADCIHRAMVRMTGNSYFKNDETGEYDMISSDAHYQCFGTIPAIDGGFVIPYIDRQKYNHCLGNAWLCKKLSKAYTWFAYNHRGWKANTAYDMKADRWRKWARRWMELAKNLDKLHQEYC